MYFEGRSALFRLYGYVRLTLNPLEFPTSPLLARFLSFLHSRIPGQATGFFEHASGCRIADQQRARKAHLERAGLAGGAAAGHTDGDVEFIFQIREFQRLKNGDPIGLARKIVREFTAIDQNGALPRRQNDARDRAFAAACTGIFDHFNHLI